MATTAKTEIVAQPGVPQILITRAFDAPRELLFRAHMEPDLVRQWLGPRTMTVSQIEVDPRDGGIWHFVHQDDAGHEYGFRGVFHGTPTAERIVRTFEFLGTPGHVSLETLTMEERDGQTVLHENSVFQSIEDRDAMIQSGMERGVNDSMERLEELLARLTAAR